MRLPKTGGVTRTRETIEFIEKDYIRVKDEQDSDGLDYMCLIGTICIKYQSNFGSDCFVRWS